MNRIVWLDWAKFFLIYLMIVGHSSPDVISDTIICSFHMSAFFFLSGVLEKKSAYWMGGGVIKRLLIPIFVFNFIGYVCWMMDSIINSTFVWNLNEIVIKPMLGMFMYGEMATPMNGPMWFVVTLLFVKIGFNVMRNHLLVISIAAIICVILLNKYHFLGSDFIGRICFSLPFYILGYKAKPQLQNVMNLPAAIRFLIAIMAILLLVPMALWNTRGGIFSFHFGKSILMYYITCLVGTIVTVLLVSFLNNARVLIVRFISNGTLVILGTHFLILRYLIGDIFIGNAWITAAIVLFLCMPLTFLFNNYLPTLVGKK